MKPIGPLMIEHRTIERMLSVFARERRRIVKTGHIDYGALRISLEFFKTYIDEFHHGKEEHILFRDLDKKPLSPEDRTLMGELMDDHSRARSVVQKLEKVVRYREEAHVTLEEITSQMENLLKWYPAHIKKEDKHFFIHAMNYLSDQEQASMLEELREFDRNFTQDRYTGLITDLEEYLSLKERGAAA
jgi:hemerythrin-like domain-containing protein